MTQVEINQQTAQVLEDLSKQTKKSMDEMISFLVNNFAYAVIEADQRTVDEDVTWADEELAELLQPKKPLTGKQIAEQGLLGGWADMGITDSVEWVNQQKEKRRNKHQW